MTNSLIEKYRPELFDEVRGQAGAVKALKSVLKRGTAHAFLLTGPSGVGKTTLAKIACRELKCGASAILDIDAATHTGIDAMRRVQDLLQYRPIGGSSSRAVILDECHRLSGNAWDSLLKILESPPENVTWWFCTTNPGKLPDTVKTRCATIPLKSLSDRDLLELINDVAFSEGIELNPAVADVIVREAGGSPRKALGNLALCLDTKSGKEAAEILHSAVESDSVMELCRFLIQGGTWAKAMGIVAKLKGENPESVRIVVSNYMAAAAKNSGGDNKTVRFLKIMDAFSRPYNDSDGQAPLLLSIGEIIFGGQ